MVFHITAAVSGKARLESDERVLAEHFAAIAAKLRQTPVRARKIGWVAARRASRRETVETRWNGTETTNTAQPGDWIVTNLSPQQEVLRDSQGTVNSYVITADRFPSLYEPAGGRNEYGAIYRAKGVVEAIHLPGGFDIVAPWGERQQAPAGYLLLNGEEVYGNDVGTFATTYETLRCARSLYNPSVEHLVARCPFLDALAKHARYNLRKGGHRGPLTRGSRHARGREVALASP
jgi:hypothetical protein